MNEHTKCTREEDREASCKSGETRRNDRLRRGPMPSTRDTPKRLATPCQLKTLAREFFFFSNYTFILKLNCFPQNIFNFIVFFFSDCHWKFCWKIKIFSWIFWIIHWKSILLTFLLLFIIIYWLSVKKYYSKVIK